MTRDEIEAALDRSEHAVADGSTQLAATGFWKAVGAVKRDPGLGARYSRRIADIDRRAFENWALLSVPAAVGTTAMVVATVVGFGLVVWAYSLDQPANGLVLLAGTVTTMVATHGLAHLVVGRVFGIRFTHWFIGSLRMPQPGVKLDYATYLAAAPRERAWMHASGAVLTKLIPFFALGPSLVMGAPWWTTALLVAIGGAGLITDVVFSTGSSDWKRYAREMKFVHTV